MQSRDMRHNGCPERMSVASDMAILRAQMWRICFWLMDCNPLCSGPSRGTCDLCTVSRGLETFPVDSNLATYLTK